MKFAEYGIELSRRDATEMLPMVRKMTIELKRSLFDKELLYVYNDLVHKKAHEATLARRAREKAN